MSNKLTAAVRFPLARIVQGDLYEPDDTDIDGVKKVYPAGHAKAGQSKWTWFFAIAIPKTKAVWWEEPWGVPIAELGEKSWPQGQWRLPTFAWKIQDGDSTTPNKKGRINARTEGMPGCWIVNLSSGIAPKVWECVNGGFVQLQQNGLVKCGYYVEVNANMASNERTSNPGIYINHEHIVYRGGGPADVISTSTPVSTLGFGTAALPAGVTAQSLGGSAPPMGSPAPTMGAPTMGAPTMGAPTMGAPTMGAPAMGAPAMGLPAPTMGAPTMGAPVGVAPNPGFIAPPVGGAPTMAAPAAPMAAPAPAAPAAPVAAYVCPAGAPAGYRMANPAGARYEGYKANNWSDAQMVTGGHMVKL